MRENRLAVKSTMQIYEIYIKLYTKYGEISIVVLPEYGLWNQESFVTFDSGRLSAVCGHPESKNGVSCKNPAFFQRISRDFSSPSGKKPAVLRPPEKNNYLPLKDSRLLNSSEATKLTAIMKKDTKVVVFQPRTQLSSKIEGTTDKNRPKMMENVGV